MRPIVSVIMPVHNAGQYLEPALNALLHQTLSNIQIVLVNDAATDGSADVCRLYAQRFPGMITLVEHAASLGTGRARAAGIAVATGEYIAFSDHDDLATPHMLETLVTAARKRKADMVVAGYTIHRNGIQKPVMPSGMVSATLGKQQTVLFPVWNKLFRTDFLRQNDITPPPTRTFEDVVFVYKALACGPNVAFVDSSLYNHILRTGSATYDILLRCETLDGLADLRAFLIRRGLFRNFFSMYLRMVCLHAVYYPACLFFIDSLWHGHRRSHNVRNVWRYLAAFFRFIITGSRGRTSA